MAPAESFAQRVQRHRVARGLSERVLAERVGMTVHQYESLTTAGISPTCPLLVDLADALDVSISDLTERIVEPAPATEELRAFRLELRWRQATMVRDKPERSRVDRRLAKLDEALARDSEPSADPLDPSIALMGAIERNEPLRVVASWYARFVLQRCAGKRLVAGRVLGVQHQTFAKYLRYAGEDDRTVMQVDGATAGNRRTTRTSEGDVVSAPIGS